MPKHQIHFRPYVGSSIFDINDFHTALRIHDAATAKKPLTHTASVMARKITFSQQRQGNQTHKCTLSF